MKDTKLVLLIKELSKSPSDMRKLRGYLNYSCTKQNSHQQILFEYFYALKGNFKDDFLVKEVVYKHLFPKEPEFKNQQLRDLTSSLLAKINDYLLLEEVKQTKEIKGQLLARAYKKRNLEKLHDKTLRLSLIHI